MNSRHIVRGISLSHESADFVVCLGVVVDVAFAVDEDDVSSQRFGTIIRDVEVVRSTSLNTSWAGEKQVSKASVKLRQYLLYKADGGPRRRRSVGKLATSDEERERQDNLGVFHGWLWR